MSVRRLYGMHDKKWATFFFILLGLWSLVLLSTVISRVNGFYGLVDYSVDLSFLTTPLLGIVLIYTVVTMFIFVAYLLTIKKAKKYQRSKYESLSTLPERSKDLTSLFNQNGMNNRICSIIIPSRNEETVIRRTVTECLKQTYPYIEIIVVCHNCSDRTFEEAQVSDPRVRVFDLKTKEVGKGIALNYGVEQSKGKYLLILDGDGTLSSNFIELALPMITGNCAAVQGRYMPSNRNYNLLTRLLSIEGDLWSTPFMTVRSVMDKRCPLGGTGYIVRKDALKAVGLFENHLVDDFELTFRLLRNKYRIAFAPLCIDYDEKPPALDIMFRQRSRWAKGFMSLLKSRITEKTDILGYFSWLWPVASLASLVMLLIPAYSVIHYLLYEYYPFTYSYLSLNLWIILNVIMYGLQGAVLIKEHGIHAAKYIPYLFLYNAFSQYAFIAYVKGFFIKSWANTKTQHGFLQKLEKSLIAK